MHAMLPDDNYDCYCARMAELKALATGTAPTRRRPHRLPPAAYAQSDVDFFITVCAKDRASQPLRYEPIAKGIEQALWWTRRQYRWILYCYCIMPDHLHFIARLPDGDVRMMDGGARGIVPQGILDHVGNLKKYTTTQVWWKHGGRGELWQTSSYDRVLLHGRSVAAAVRYVLDNPVRAKLANHWSGYPYARLVDAAISDIA